MIMNRKKIVTYITIVLIAGLLLAWNSSKAFLSSSQPSDPYADTQYLLEITKRAKIRLSSGLWEWIVSYNRPLRFDDLEQELDKLQQIFSLPKEPFGRTEQGLLEYTYIQSQDGALSSSYRFLGIPTRDGAYRAELIVKLEATSIDEHFLQQPLQHFDKKIKLLHKTPAFYTCIKGSTDGTLYEVQAILAKVFATYDDGHFVERYEDGASFGVRHLGNRSTQILMHWNKQTNRTEITLGTPFIITEF